MTDYKRRVWYGKVINPNGTTDFQETVIAEEGEAVAKWKWCKQCEHREIEVLKRGSHSAEGHDRCDKEACGYEYVYPTMDGEKRLLSKRCPYYAEALMESLNKSRKKTK